MTTFWVPLQRDVITVHGADARTYLHSQLSQDIASMRVGETRQSLLLQPTGKICGILRVTCLDSETFLLDCDSGTGEAVLVRLNRFKIRVKAELSLGQETWTAVRNAITPVGGAIPAWKSDGSAWDVRGDLSDTSIPQGTQDDYETARICSSWPVMNIDVTESSIPAESGLTDIAVSFSKGCYPGQELVERMDSRSAVAPRQLRYATVEQGTLVGQEVRVEERIGVVTSVCGCHALALFRRA
jgi:tRNA-modifying protein YgfZ